MVLCCDVTEAKLNLFVFLLRERYFQYVVCFVLFLFLLNCAGKAKGQIIVGKKA